MTIARIIIALTIVGTFLASVGSTASATCLGAEASITPSGGPTTTVGDACAVPTGFPAQLRVAHERDNIVVGEVSVVVLVPLP